MTQARIRSMKPELWQSPDFRALSTLGKLTFLCLIGNSDDDGRMRTNAHHLATVFLDEDIRAVQKQLDQLERQEMLVTYSERRVDYTSLVNFRKHQRIDKPKSSPLPPPPSRKRPAKRQLELGLVADESRRISDASQPDQIRSRSVSVSVSPTSSSPNGSSSGALIVSQVEDAAELCEALSDALEGWGAKGDVTAAWQRDAERLLRIDHRPIDEALDVLHWATSDDFWRPNIRSIAKFRKQYDTLRGQMMRKPQTAAARLEQSIESDLDRAAQLRAEGR